MLRSNHVLIDGINVRGVCSRLFVSIMLVAPAAEATDFELRIAELERQVREAKTTINLLSQQISALKRQQEGQNNSISTDGFPPANQRQRNFLTSGLDLGGFYHVAVTGVAGEAENAVSVNRQNLEVIASADLNHAWSIFFAQSFLRESELMYDDPAARLEPAFSIKSSSDTMIVWGNYSYNHSLDVPGLMRALPIFTRALPPLIFEDLTLLADSLNPTRSV